jgi:release factor glutamine methyltransferase
MLIEQLKAHDVKTFSTLDLCTGTGCIALAIAHAFPQSVVYGTDISTEALACARKNVQNNNIQNVSFISSDLFQNIDDDARYDIIVSNPPYISEHEWQSMKPRVTDWEDPRALLAPDEGLGLITDIIATAQNHLKQWSSPIPQLWIEIGYRQGGAVAELFEKHGFHSVVIHQDTYGNDRVVTGSMHNNS